MHFYSSNVIESLKMIERKLPPSQQTSTIVVRKPVAKKAGHRSHNSSESNSKSGNTSIQNKPKHMEDHKSQQNESFSKTNNNNNRRDKNLKGKHSKGWKDEECFGAPTTEAITQDFDFESNLALFDKQALWQQLSNNQKPDIIKQTESRRSRRPMNYRYV